MHALRENGRALRAALAVAITVALAILYAQQESQTNRKNERALYAVTATSWKISELIFEAQQFSMALKLHANGEVKRSDAQMQFELLWSRVEVVAATEVIEDPKVAALVERYRTFLTESEKVIFEAKIIPPHKAVRMSRVISDLAREMRVVWVGTFKTNPLSERSMPIDAVTQLDNVQLVIIGLMCLLILYVLTEIAFASIAQRREQRLRQAAAEANEAKSRFLANVSHEIRTPLNGILGMTSELRETALDPDQKGCLEIIRQSGKLLLATLNDVLDLSKVEAGAIELECNPFDLHEVINSAHALYRQSAREKKLDFETEIAAGLPRKVIGDGTRLRQILHNLISNALKFTSSGMVKVSVTPQRDGSAMRFQVSDTGPGIDPRAQEKIFSPFSQADASVTRKHGGTGLGLSISQQLVGAMGGVIQVNSSPGKGATFWFDIELPPVAETPTVPTEVHDPADVSVDMSFRVLIADDNATNRMILRRFLKGQCHHIDEVANGRDAVLAVQANDHDVVLMDIQMPVMDGVEATRQIRQAERNREGSRCFILAVTANVAEEQVRDYISQGMDAVIAKPVSKKSLLAKLADRKSGGDAMAGAA